MLFKFCKLTRRNNNTQQQKQQQGDQMTTSDEQQHEISFVGRISRSLSKLRQRRSKSASSFKNNVVKPIDNTIITNNSTAAAVVLLPARSRYQQDDNISNCSSIELVRHLQSRAPSSLLGQLAISNQHQAEPNNNQKTQSFLSMCDNNISQFANEQEVPTAAAPALATISNFDNNNFQDELLLVDHDEEERNLAERRANYARRNIGAMRRHNLLPSKKQQGKEWMFKLYDLPGSDTDKQDMTEVAKSIRKTLVSSLTPLLVETTSHLRQIAVPQQTNSNQQLVGDASAGSNNSAAALHLHITMKPEVVAPSQQSSSSPQQDIDGSVSPSSSNNNNNNNTTDAVCVVRVSATISSNDEQRYPAMSISPAGVVPQEERASPISTTGDCLNNNKDKQYMKSLQQIDDIMLQSLPAELFDNRALMKRERRLRRHRNQKLVDSAVQTGDAVNSNMFVHSADEEKDAPVYYQQQILMRRGHQQQSHSKMQPTMGLKSVAQRSFVRPNLQQSADMRRARVVPLNQPQQHFYHYEKDDLFSETSVIGTYEERACSIAKCLHWMSKLSEEDATVPPASPAKKLTTTTNNHQRRPQQRPSKQAQPSPVVAIGAGEALAVPPCHVYEYHHIHHHKHFVARI